MKNIFGKTPYYYFTTILFFLASLVVYGIYFYWTNGPANIENINNIFSAASKIDQVRESNGFEDVLKYVKKYKIRSAVKIVEKLDRETKDFGNDFDLESYGIFRKDLKVFGQQLQQLLSYPEINSIFVVLINKISMFEDYAVGKNWKTLTRISKRLHTKVTIGKSSALSEDRVQKLIETIKKDVDMMSRLTNSSMLSPMDKDAVLSKLSGLTVEVDMLDKYLSVIMAFNKDYSNINQSYGKWMSELAPLVSLKKIEFERYSQNFLFALVLFLGLILVFLIIGYFVFNSSKKIATSSLEQTILDLVKETLVPLNPTLKYEMSPRFQEELEKFREYLHKRMSFGSIFQDGMPFSSILLDSNLNLVWANHLFYENWGMTQKRSNEDGITWDYIQQYTNLGISDPIVSALHDQVAGIYQIQVKTKNTKESVPYEMYVSPVSYADQNRVMIIFYPLHSMEETLIHQTQSLVGPVGRTLDALSLGGFDNEFKEKIKKDFDVANIENIFEKFEVLDRLQNDERKSFIDNIHELENKNYDMQKTIDDITTIYTEEKSLHEITRNQFLNAKDAIVDLVGLRQKLEKIFLEITDVTARVVNDELKTLNSLKESYDSISENNNSLNAINQLRQELKDVKNSLDHVRGRIVSGIGSVRAKKHTEQTLSKLNDDFTEFEKYMRTFSKVIISLDVKLDKSEEYSNISLLNKIEEFHEELALNRQSLDFYIHEGGSIIDQASHKDEYMIESFGSLYSSFEESRKKSLEVTPLLN